MQLVEAARIGRRRDGKLYCEEVFMQYGKPLSAAEAIDRLAHGRMAFVNRADAKAVFAKALEMEEGKNERLDNTGN